MKKELIAALTLTFASGLALAGEDAMQSSQTSERGASDSSSSSTTSSTPTTRSNSTTGGQSSSTASSTGGQSGQGSFSQAGSGDNAWMVELSADPKTALFQRLDADKNGYLSQQEAQSYKDEVALNLDRARSGSKGGEQGIDIVAFKTAVTNSMLGLSDQGGNQSLESFAHGGLDTQSSPADSNAQGMQSDKVMDQVVEEQGGPTMLRGGPNPSPTQLTPEQTLTQ